MSVHYQADLRHPAPVLDGMLVYRRATPSVKFACARGTLRVKCLLKLEPVSSPIYIFVPNRTFLVRFGDISGEFGRAMVRILARRSRAKIPMARPNEPDIPPKRTKKVRLGIYPT